MTRTARAPLIVLMILIFGWGWLDRAAILGGIGNLWVVSDQIEDADAVVVLGGGVNTRPLAAANLWSAGAAKLVLLTVTPFDTELNRTVLIKQGVAPEAIIDIGHNVSSTYEEARAVREWAQQSGAKKIIFITEMFPSRRVRWIFDRQLAPLGVKVILRPYPGANFDFERWWQDQRGIAIFASETLKYLYYRLMY